MNAIALTALSVATLTGGKFPAVFDWNTIPCTRTAEVTLQGNNGPVSVDPIVTPFTVSVDRLEVTETSRSDVVSTVYRYHPDRKLKEIVTTHTTFSPGSQTESFEYDPAGRLIAQLANRTYTDNAPNQMVKVEFAYSPQGAVAEKLESRCTGCAAAGLQKTQLTRFILSESGSTQAHRHFRYAGDQLDEEHFTEIRFSRNERGDLSEILWSDGSRRQINEYWSGATPAERAEGAYVTSSLDFRGSEPQGTVSAVFDGFGRPVQVEKVFPDGLIRRSKTTTDFSCR